MCNCQARKQTYGSQYENDRYETGAESVLRLEDGLYQLLLVGAGDAKYRARSESLRDLTLALS
jgi:hypothetical protein